MISVAAVRRDATQQDEVVTRKSCEVDRSAGREILLRSEGANDGVTGAELLLCSTVLFATCFPHNFSSQVDWVDTTFSNVSNTYAACIAAELGGP